ncbi:MAG: 23S rRNA (pseudouridine(1915)-N(3))-methyltransferase RlmH [Clostridiaceae bacterium]|nr:23S rRNA (pseudouridine(1915)-N(3))-methyltransferase RlmH [Clostridiaceae bacterium]
MQIQFLCVGKMREKWLQVGFAEYKKRLSRFATISVLEVADSPDHFNPAVAVAKEAELLRKRLPKSGFKVALDLHGKAFSSLEFAKQLSDWQIKGGGKITFVIAGSNGYEQDFLDLMDERISLSPLTFPHQLTRLILAEQIFRGFKILNNERYHK